MVTAARFVVDGKIDVDDPTAAVRSDDDDAASSMLALEKGNCNKNETKDIGIQVE